MPPSIYDTPYDELPYPRQVWVGEPSSHEEGMGKVSLLTPELVAKTAAEEIKTGQRVTMNWDLTKLEYSVAGRHKTQHHIVPIVQGVAFDDVYLMNPQNGTQWDGLRHCSQAVPAKGDEPPPERVFYGGTTAAEIQDRHSDRIGIQHWAQAGIVGRGVLIDYVSHAEKKGVKYSSFERHEIKLLDILEIAKECNIELRKGDILLIRGGTTKEWDSMSMADKATYSTAGNLSQIGVEATEDMLRFLWNTGFAAVAGDAFAFEVWPPQGPILLHEYLLAGWGMPIGELFDLEQLAQTCEQLDRWSFFFTSTPLNQPGGVSSPPNAMAIF